MYIASLVLGILSLLFSWVPIIGFIISIIALIVSILAMVKKNSQNKGRGMEIAGMVLSIIALIISLIMTIIVFRGAYIITKNSKDVSEKANIALELSDRVNAKAKLTVIFADVLDASGTTEYTGYINEYTMEYTDRLSGIEAEEFYENKLEEMGYDYDVIVDFEGMPSIKE